MAGVKGWKEEDQCKAAFDVILWDSLASLMICTAKQLLEGEGGESRSPSISISLVKAKQM